MIQFNLLPDVKQEYIKAQRTKRLVLTTAVLASIGALGLLIVLSLSVFVFQKQYMKIVTKDITKYSNDLKDTPDLDKILTIQNQLNSLTALHEKKADTTRLIPFIQQLTPNNVSIATLNVDYTTNTMSISGAADSLQVINQYVDTLKFTKYTDGNSQPLAFTSVVLSSFGRSEQDATYTIDATFEAAIFDNTKAIKLIVPEKVTTRSETEKPTTLFESSTTNAGGQN
jgi:hypothetical protein